MGDYWTALSNLEKTLEIVDTSCEFRNAILVEIYANKAATLDVPC